MNWKRLGLTLAVLGTAFGVTGCSSGYGYGGGVALGYGDRYYDGYGYEDAYYGGYGYPSYYGWYNDFYYPGTGIYVYDRYRRPYRWNSTQQRYWQGQVNQYRRGNPGFRGNPQIRENFSQFRQENRAERRDYRGDLRTNREAYQAGTINRDQFRQGRRDARQEYRSDVRSNFRDLRRENRQELRSSGSAAPNGGARTGGSGRPGGGGRRNR